MACAVAREYRLLLNVLICSNVRGGPVFAVADAYEEWYDLGDEEVVSLLEASGLSGS